MNDIAWIKSSKALPRVNDKVLVICCGSLLEAWFDGIQWLNTNCKFHKSAISHWAKIKRPTIRKPKKKPFVGKRSAQLMGAKFQAFKSPLDGSVITCPSKLRDHNKKHGVTNIKDYPANHFEKRGKEMKNEALGQTPEAKMERCKLIDKTLNDYGV